MMYTCLTYLHHGDAGTAKLHVLIAAGDNVGHGVEILADQLAQDA